MDDPLITLESDKATMDIPVAAGRHGGGGARSRPATGCPQGSLILLLEAEGAAAIPPKERDPRGCRARDRRSRRATARRAGVYETIEVKVPDIGDFKDVPVIEVHVQPGDEVKAEDRCITLESDKATMEVPAPAARPRAGGARSRSATRSPRAA